MTWKNTAEFTAAVTRIFTSARLIEDGERKCRAAASAPPYLDHCTHESSDQEPTPRPVIPTSTGDKAPWGGEYTELSVTRYRDRSVDVAIIERPAWYVPPKHRRSWERAMRGTDRKEAMTPEDLQRSANRAKANIRRACCQLQVDRMLTATFRDNVQDQDLAWRVFANFRRLYREMLPYEFRISHQRFRVESFEYVCVPEPQKRGAVHFHLGLNQAHDINRLRRAWQAAQKLCELESPDGNINIKRTFIGSRSGNTSSRNCAKYIGKYINKALGGGVMWKKRFSVSKGIPEPVVTRYYFMDVYSTEELLEFAAGIVGGATPQGVFHAKVGPFDAAFVSLMPP